MEDPKEPTDIERLFAVLQSFSPHYELERSSAHDERQFIMTISGSAGFMFDKDGKYIQDFPD